MNECICNICYSETQNLQINRKHINTEAIDSIPTRHIQSIKISNDHLKNYPTNAPDSHEDSSFNSLDLNVEENCLSPQDLHSHSQYKVHFDNKNSSFHFDNIGLHVSCLNIHYLMPKLDEIRHILSQFNSPDIIGLCETFLNEDTSNNELYVTNYNFERKDRPLKKGGGLIVYINENVKYIRRYDLESSEIESICIEVNLKNYKPFIIMFIYRPPDSKQNWIENFEKIADKLDNLLLEYYVLGDTNINYCPKNKYFLNNKWNEFNLKFGLSQLISEPTRVTKNSSTIIDHIYTNCTDYVQDIHVPEYSISDHYPICFTRITDKIKIKNHNHKTMTYRSFRGFNNDAFNSDLVNAGIDVIVQYNDVNMAMESFYKIFQDVLNKHAPIKEKRIKHDSQPEWFSEEILTAIHKRNHLHKVKKYSEYKEQRNLVKSMIKKSKKNFYNKCIKNNTSTNVLWKNIKAISNKATKKNEIPRNIVYNGDKIENQLQILNAFNEHFVNISNLVQKTELVKDNFIPLKQFLSKKLNHANFDIKTITPFEVSKIIEKLNPNKSTGLDGISAKTLKYSSDAITPSISHIINKSIEMGIFPDRLKDAFVVPIFKTGDKHDPNNYRPISILPTISKIFEIHIATQLQQYFKDTDVIHPHQSGFRPNHSCHTSLIHMIDSWIKDIDSNRYVGSVFLDLKKAFDLVDHEILVHKLKLYNFSKNTVDLFKSYLSNRTQVIKDGSQVSKQCIIKSGVPQGSILGPLLFILYINDLALETNSSITQYADDSTIYKSDKNLSALETILQSDIDKIEKWCKVNNMAINPSKTTCMIVSSKSKRHKNNEPTLHLQIGGKTIENVTVQKTLGVYVDNTLTWNFQLKKVCGKLNSNIALMKRISYYLTYEMKILFYNSYILSKMDYCYSVWGNNRKSINTMNKIQSRVGKIISRNTIPRKDSNNVYKWLSFESKILYQVAVLVYKGEICETPNYINQLLTVSRNSSYCLRSKTMRNLEIPKFNTELFKQTFSYMSVKAWNALPIEIRKINNLQTFKKALKSHLLRTYC